MKIWRLHCLISSSDCTRGRGVHGGGIDNWSRRAAPPRHPVVMTRSRFKLASSLLPMVNDYLKKYIFDDGVDWFQRKLSSTTNE